MANRFELGGNVFFTDTGQYVRVDEIVTQGSPTGSRLNAATPAVHRLDEIDLEPTAWQTDAACRGIGTELFFAEDAASREMAALICEDCPVLALCSDFATANKEWGTWGGKYRGTKAS